MLRWNLGGIVSIGLGIWFLVRYTSGLPALDPLATVTGVVSSADVETRRSRRSSSQMLAVRIGDKPAAFYKDGFPDSNVSSRRSGPGTR